MASSYSSDIKLELMVTGEKAGLWGNITNTNLQILEQAASGYLRLLTPPTNPRVIGPAIADAVTGQYAAMGILAALMERSKTGKGRRLDISMLEAMCHFNLDSFTHYYSVNEVMGPLSRPVVSQSYTFECADGKWIAIHMSSPVKFWEGLLAATGQGQLKEDPRFAERLTAPVLTALLLQRCLGACYIRADFGIFEFD